MLYHAVIAAMPQGDDAFVKLTVLTTYLIAPMYRLVSKKFHTTVL